MGLVEHVNRKFIASPPANPLPPHHITQLCVKKISLHVCTQHVFPSNVAVFCQRGTANVARNYSYQESFSYHSYRDDRLVLEMFKSTCSLAAWLTHSHSLDSSTVLSLIQTTIGTVFLNVKLLAASLCLFCVLKLVYCKVILQCAVIGI